jgi:hypothetical protein
MPIESEINYYLRIPLGDNSEGVWINSLCRCPENLIRVKNPAVQLKKFLAKVVGCTARSRAGSKGWRNIPVTLGTLNEG